MTDESDIETSELNALANDDEGGEDARGLNYLDEATEWVNEHCPDLDGIARTAKILQVAHEIGMMDDAMAAAAEGNGS